MDRERVTDLELTRACLRRYHLNHALTINILPPAVQCFTSLFSHYTAQFIASLWTYICPEPSIAADMLKSRAAHPVASEQLLNHYLNGLFDPESCDDCFDQANLETYLKNEPSRL